MQKKMSKKQGKKMLVGALAVALGLSVLIPNSVFAADDFEGMKAIQTFPDALMVDYVNKDYKESDKAPQGYTFFEKYTKDTKVEVFGVENHTIDSKTTQNPTFDLRSIFHVFETRANKPGTFGVWYRNAGTFDGKTIDIKMTVMSYDEFNSSKNVSPVIGFHRDTRIGVSMYGLNDMKIKREYFDHATGKLVSVKGFATLTDIDSKQGVTIPKTGISNLYVSPTSPLLYKETADGHMFYDPDDINADKNVADGIYDNGVGWNQDYMISYLFQGSSMDTVYHLNQAALNRNPDTTWYGGNVGFDNDARKPVPTQISEPEKTVSDSDEKDVVKNDLSALNEVFTYHVSHYVAGEFEPFFYSNYAITDQLATVLDITGTKVLNEEKKDVSSDFTISVDNKTNKVVAKAKNVNKAEFYDHTYTLVIDTKIKKNADLTSYIQNGKTEIPNKANVIVDDKSHVSNEVVTTPPDFTKPVVSKTVSDDDEKDKLDHATLAKRDELIKWNVDYNFGNTTSNWDSASLTDDINEFLTIESVKVVNAEGADVTKEGTLSIDKETNKVSFAIDSKNGSYDFLAGQTYHLLVDTKVKADATDAQLAKYMDKEGIPNEGVLQFDQNGNLNVEKSNIPTVDVPTSPVTPIVSKTVSDDDEKDKSEHVSLLDRTELIQWNVNYDFGNTTYTWDDAVLVDDINPLLDIVAVKVVNAEGTDVTKEGTLSVDKKTNKVSFSIKSKDDSFTFLSGQTYHLLVDTKVKADATDADLKPYMDKEGIPNEGVLQFDQNGKLNVEKSNIPTVDVPKNPTIKPVQPAKIVPAPKTPKATPVKVEKQKQEGKMPKTGDTMSWRLMIGGAIIVLASGTYLLMRRRKKQAEDVTK
ncbi:isopeptide-forming domain-containing fimbrial protein [Listeria booriae]|uniref:Isopeptide-forming domain-containing fimbrial protein n=1 Tax=Listeria booriae TaxID=1552123 RepID=A0A841ZX34_9LIST|nr:isopeptide-forming domain-containing fimbrial protein [Listeria booriae]MBC1565054.1 isopeptide-forming domain-containing fimbrial protein [Listeria booriae]